MRKIISLLVMVVLLTSFVSCSKNSKVNDDILLEHTYDGEFFSIDYPSGFTPIIIREDNPGVILSSKDTKFVIEAYANWNDNCREGDVYRLWHNGEDYWDELTEIMSGKNSALFAYAKGKYDWAFMSVTIPRRGWELIATATEFSDEEYGLVKTILTSMRITDQEFTLELVGPQYEPFDLLSEPVFSTQTCETEFLRIFCEGELSKGNSDNIKIVCDGYSINILPIVDWLCKADDMNQLLKLQDWEGVELESQRIEEVVVDGRKSIWSESLKEKIKTISISIPMNGGYFFAVASGMNTKEKIIEAGNSLLSIKILDDLHFGSK